MTDIARIDYRIKVLTAVLEKAAMELGVKRGYRPGVSASQAALCRVSATADKVFLEIVRLKRDRMQAIREGDEYTSPGFLAREALSRAERRTFGEWVSYDTSSGPIIYAATRDTQPSRWMDSRGRWVGECQGENE